MAIPPPNDSTQKLPSIPSAGNINNYYPMTTPATQRLGLGPNVYTGSQTGNKRLVYTGQMDVQQPAGFPYKDPNKMITKKVDRLVDASDAMYMMYTLAPEARKQLNDLTTSYFGHNRWAPSWQDNVWKQAVQVSANSVAYGNRGDWIDPVTAFGLVVNDMAAGSAGGRGGGGGAGGGYSGPVTTTQVNKSVNLTDPTTARGLIKNALTGYLGRDATDKEQESFLTALNRAERRSPAVTKSVSTTTPGVGASRVESETVSRGGFNPSTFAEEYAQGMEGSAEFQAATNLLDTFIGSLSARV